MKKLIFTLLFVILALPLAALAEEHEVLGCMDKKASNYNKLATKDDGSCVYEGGSYFATHLAFSDLYRPVAVNGGNVFVGILAGKAVPVKLIVGKTTTKADYTFTSEHKDTWTYHTFKFNLPAGRYYAKAVSYWQGLEVSGGYFPIEVK